MTSWMIYFFSDPLSGFVRHFPTSGAAIIAAKLAHEQSGTQNVIHIRKRQSVKMNQQSLIGILNGEGWDIPGSPSKLVYTVGVGGGHDVKWYDTELLNGRNSGRNSRSQEHPSDGMASAG